ARRENTDSVYRPRLLGLGGERPESEADSENNREPDHPHGRLGGERAAGSQGTQSRFDGLMMSINCSTDVRGPEMIRLLVGLYGTIRPRGKAIKQSVGANSPARGEVSG